MSIEENLTDLQRAALQGEVAYVLSTCAHDADIKYRIYLVLKEVEKDYVPLLMDAFKQSVKFDESIVDKIYLETLSGKTPVWIWIEKSIADLKEALKLASTNTTIQLSIDKEEERKKDNQ